jgi:hypothetical protein
MSINGMVVGENRLSASTPGYKPYGFYVSNAGYATNVSIYNVDAHLNSVAGVRSSVVGDRLLEVWF